MTDAELRLWKSLKSRDLAGHKFRRQHPIGPYVADFACPECKLVVELDGGQHALSIERDTKRTRDLAAFGYRVLRFWDHEMLTNSQGVLDTIYETLISSPQPSPQRGEGEVGSPSSEHDGAACSASVKHEREVSSLSLERERVG